MQNKHVQNSCNTGLSMKITKLLEHENYQSNNHAMDDWKDRKKKTEVERCCIKRDEGVKSTARRSKRPENSERETDHKITKSLGPLTPGGVVACHA